MMIKVRDPLAHIANEFPSGYYEAVEKPLAVETERWLAERAKNSTALDTSSEKIAEIREHILETNPSEVFMRDYWPGLAERLKNPALAKLIQTPQRDGIGGDRSEFLPMLLCLLPSAMSLEMAWLHGLNTRLEFTEITPEDPYYWTATREKLYKYIRIRSAWSADVMAKIKPTHSVFLSCGRMFAKRYVDQTVYGTSEMTDIDESITFESLFPQAEEEFLSSYRLYHVDDETLLRDSAPNSLDFVEMMGRAIYMFTKNDCTQLSDTIRLVLSRMERGGRFVFDVNCAHPDWDKLLMPIAFARGNIQMTLLKNNAEIIDLLFKRVLESLPCTKIRFEPLQLEGRDIGVLFCIMK